jgi:hypothetical protein
VRRAGVVGGKGAGALTVAAFGSCLIAAFGMWFIAATAAAHAGVARTARLADAPPARTHAPARVQPAPSGPPLTGAGANVATGAEAAAGEDPAAGTRHGEVDPLVSNGLGSPLCTNAPGGADLTGQSRRNCELSGFVAAAAPTGDYGIDVHIDTGLLGLSSGGLLATVQDLFVTPVWMAVVWAVHALIVMLEWAFTIDLLDSAAAGGLSGGLRHMQSTITDPWLAAVLAVASLLALYNGLIRRRVAETIGEALLMATMVVGGMWVIANPSGTVGVLGRWANQASLGTVAATARGSPSVAGRTLADSMGMLFTAIVEAPWCYLEFGDVAWCRNPRRLSRRLRQAGLRIAATESALVGCGSSAGPLRACVPRGSTQAVALEHSAELLRVAQSNGAIFLALPANGPARNSINQADSLLRAICQSSEATNCRGRTAAQAEFRTSGGTWARVGGLLLIVAGVLGMVLMVGFIVLRLLTAAMFALLYLLLAPAAVLAPAFGEAGRTVFRRWATQLLAAVASKLLFAFLLGAVLAILAILIELEALGWWTQWLLMSAFWWAAFTRRHQALGIVGGTLVADRAGRARPLGRRAGAAIGSSSRALGLARAARERFATPSPGRDRPPRVAEAGRRWAGAGMDGQVGRLLEQEFRAATDRLRSAPEIQGRLAAERARLARIGGERERARASGNTRRAGELRARAARIELELAREQQGLIDARTAVEDGEMARRRAGRLYTREQAEARERFLDDQTQLPAAAARRGGASAPRRDYPALAGLAGYGREEYERLDPSRQRLARLEVDRELELRRELAATHREIAGGEAGAPLPRREQRGADRAFDTVLGRRMRDGSHATPSSAADGLGPRLSSGRFAYRTRTTTESPVMRDARAVALKRKRQLGADRD